jgi:Tfp pilus assembly protein PilF
MDNSGSAAQGLTDQDMSLKPHPAIEEKSLNVEDAEQNELGVADPMDFIMGVKKSSDETSSIEAVEQISPEPIENELTLYRDENLKLSVSDGKDNQRVIIESVKGGYKIDAPSEDHIEVTDNYDDYENDSADNTEGHLEQPQEPAPPEPSITKPEPAIQVQAPYHKDIISESSEPVTETEHPELPASLGDVMHSKGVIYLAGKTLKLTGGMRVEAGDEITINDKLFKVKLEQKRNNSMIMGIAGGALGLFALLLIISGFLSSDIGQLAGMVTDSATKAPLTGVTVQLTELNKSAKANEAGFFVFDNIPSGIHTLEYRSPDGTVNIKDRVTVIKNQTSTIVLAAGPAITVASRPQAAPVKPEPRAENEYPVTVSDKGFMKLSIVPNNSSVYVDGKPVGVGSNTYKIPAGNHDITVTKDGYAEYHQSVKIEPDKTHSFKIALTENGRSPQGGLKSNIDLALEKESSGNFKDAMRLYDQILKSNSRDLPAILGKARCAREEGLFEESISRFQQAAKIASDKHDTRAQIEALTGVIEIRPNTYNAYASRGEVHYSLGQYQKAADDFTKVVELDKRNLGAYYKLGNSYYALGNYNDALGAFQAAEEINFADPKAHVSMAKTYLALGDRRNMKRSYDKFKELASYSARLEFKKDPEWQKVLTALGEKE